MKQPQGLKSPLSTYSLRGAKAPLFHISPFHISPFHIFLYSTFLLPSPVPSLTAMTLLLIHIWRHYSRCVSSRKIWKRASISSRVRDRRRSGPKRSTTYDHMTLQ